MGIHLVECTAGLVGKGKARETLAVTDDVERAREDHDSDLLLAELLLDAKIEIAMIDARQVAGTRR